MQRLQSQVTTSTCTHYWRHSIDTLDITSRLDSRARYYRREGRTLPSSDWMTTRHRQRAIVITNVAGPSRAPSLTNDNGGNLANTKPPKTTNNGNNNNNNNNNVAKIIWKRVLRQLANLKLAIAELTAIAALSSVGTLIEQGKPYAYYLAKYPEDGPKLYGIFTGSVIWTMQWDHIYTANYFLGLLALLAASLTACTTTTQWPAVKVAQRWRFKTTPSALTSLQVSTKLPKGAKLPHLAAALSAKSYQVFVKDGALYAFKGLAGKVGPIGVHGSMLLVMAGITFGTLGSYKGSVMIPEGADSLLAAALEPSSPLALGLPQGADSLLHVDNFEIDFRPDGSIRQFISELAVRDIDGRMLKKETISVNKPLRYKGVTAYQTDWSMSALTMRIKPPGVTEWGEPFRLPFAMLEGEQGGVKLFATFLPLEDANNLPDGRTTPKGVSILARDPRILTLYDSAGQFVGVRRPGSGKAITVEGAELLMDEVVKASGMELKVDPGVPVVYAGFGGMCITTLLSYLSHSQVWAFEDEEEGGGGVMVGGKTNRAKVSFERELETVIESIPNV